MNSDKSFINYRNSLKSAQLPCIPYLAIFLRDLLYIDEVNLDKKVDGSINLPKFILMGDLIFYLNEFKRSGYDEMINMDVIKFILGFPVLNNEQTYNKSLEIEPKNII
jgi:hypothetical protein